MKYLFIILSILAIACGETKTESTTQTDNNLVSDVKDPLDTSGGKGVFFKNITDGMALQNPIIIEMGLNGMEIESAGAINPGKGHHHLIIDGQAIPLGQTVPLDDKNIHYGKGQTQDTITLAAGNHSLTLQLANGVHASYGPNWSKSIQVTVK